jgi:acyl-CoA thioesterase YciA
MMSDTDHPNRQPMLRTMPGPSDINSNGHIFGGWVLAQMDIAGGMKAGEIAQGPVATVAVEAMSFIEPIMIGDVVSLFAEVKRRGRTSVAVHVEVISTRKRGREQVKVTEGIYTFVALDSNHRPKPLPVEG